MSFSEVIREPRCFSVSVFESTQIALKQYDKTE